MFGHQAVALVRDRGSVFDVAAGQAPSCHPKAQGEGQCTARRSVETKWLTCTTGVRTPP